MKQSITLAAALSGAHILAGCAADGAEPTRVTGAEQAIVGGQQASEGQFPSIVSLRDDEGHFCGGSLIAPGWVLTAGHCVETGFRGQVGEVVAGSLDLTAEAGEHLSVFRAYRHPEYDEGIVFPENDVALLRLVGEAKAPVSKLASAQEMRWVWPGSKVQVAGWGLTDADGEEASPSLLYTEVPLVAQRECKRVFGNFYPQQAICAGLAAGGKDACYGDSGGPLYAKLGNRQLQVGVVSAGIGCGDPGWYGLYSGVANFSDWIASTITQGDGEVTALSACVSACDAELACKEGQDPWQCQPALDRCLCNCAQDESGLCDLSPKSEAEGEPSPVEAPPV